MKKKYQILFFLFLMGLFFPAKAFSLTAFLSKQQADQLYLEGDFSGALSHYQKAIQNGETPTLYYNLGDAHYKLGQFDQAYEAYLKSSESQDSKVREFSLYNLGNTQYKRGQLEEALRYYDRTLEINPQNEKAKKNREFVQKKLEEKKENKQDQQEQNKKEDSQQDQTDQKQKDSQESRQQDQQNQQNEQKQQETQQEKQDSKNSEQGHNQRESQSNQQGQGPPTEQKEENLKNKTAPDSLDNAKKENQTAQIQRGNSQGELTEGQAQRLLEMIQDDPKGPIKEMIKQDAAKKKIKVERDW